MKQYSIAIADGLQIALADQSYADLDAASRSALHSVLMILADEVGAGGSNHSVKCAVRGHGEAEELRDFKITMIIEQQR